MKAQSMRVLLKDVECPYCGADLEIDDNDGLGYGRDEEYEQECSSCGKTFLFVVNVTYSYEVRQAPCKNGGEHDLRPIGRIPRELGIGIMRCECCGDEIIIDKEAHEKAVTEYMKKLG